MNMLLHGVKDTEFEMYHGDTLTNDWDMLRETNPAKKPVFDAVVANPPFSYRWEPTGALGEDMRFKNHGVALNDRARFRAPCGHGENAEHESTRICTNLHKPDLSHFSFLFVRIRVRFVQIRVPSFRDGKGRLIAQRHLGARPTSRFCCTASTI
jgi:hypothetical protein